MSLCPGGPRTEARLGASNLNAVFTWILAARTERRLMVPAAFLHVVSGLRY
jgi:hypothetical protein